MEDPKADFLKPLREQFAKGFNPALITILAISMSFFHLYTAQFGLLTAMKQRGVHLLFGFLLVFLRHSFRKNGSTRSSASLILDWTLISLSVIAILNLTLGFEEFMMRGGEPTERDIWLGIILVILVLEATRKTLGLALPLIAVVFILYAFFGKYIPGVWGHRGIDLSSFASYQYLTTEGIFGVPLGVSASFIFIFILFGAFLVRSGMGEFFIGLANAIAGHLRGGPAIVAVLSSAVFGTISGSAVANVVGTGSFTIPLMKRIGYRPAFAGAVEAVASTGGQIMPPIMGAAAFIMADMLGISYLSVCIAAVIPAILYYWSLLWMVHLEALKLGLSGIPKEELPRLKPILKSRGFLLLPAIILVILLVLGYSPMKAGFWSIISVILISFLKKETRMNLPAFLQALEKGALGSLEVVMACACAGIVIGIITQTGLGLKFSGMIIDASGGILLVTLIFTMAVSLILGMGLTTSAAYILTVILGAPALVKLGVLPLAAHMFVFYYACLSTITPPVALAAYAGAGIAQANPFRVGFEAMRLAAVAYFVPFLFIFAPVLLFQGAPLEILTAFFTAVIGCMALGGGLQGFFLIPTYFFERVLLITSGVLLIKPGWITDGLGIGFLLLIFVVQWFRKARSKSKK